MEATALHLESRGDLRTLICFVERWAEFGEPSAAARLAQARALVSLGLMDRAWARVQDLVDAPEATVPAVTVAARMFLDRGWNKQARRALLRAMANHPDHTVLQELWERASEPPTQADFDAADLDGAPVAAMLHAAEHHIATGSFVRARGLLERVRREQPQQPRAMDLLWALDGDFTIQGSLAELTDKHGPDLTALAEFVDEAEHTAELEGNLGLEREAPEGSAFPALFRNLEPRTEFFGGRADISEVTQLTSLAELDEMRRGAADPASFGSGGEDTQILRVVHRGPTHAPVEEPSADTGGFDLAAFRREMGMHFDPNADFHDAPEQEDDDLIFHTRREETAEVTETTSSIASLDLKPEEAALPVKSRTTVDEAAQWAKAPAEEVKVHVPATPPVPPPAAPEPRPDPSQVTARPMADNAWPWGLALGGGLVLFGGGSVALFVLFQVLSWIS